MRNARKILYQNVKLRGLDRRMLSKLIFHKLGEKERTGFTGLMPSSNLFLLHRPTVKFILYIFLEKPKTKLGLFWHLFKRGKGPESTIVSRNPQTGNLMA
jgi:hypothetical protein